MLKLYSRDIFELCNVTIDNDLVCFLCVEYQQNVERTTSHQL